MIMRDHPITDKYSILFCTFRYFSIIDHNLCGHRPHALCIYAVGPRTRLCRKISLSSLSRVDVDVLCARRHHQSGKFESNLGFTSEENEGMRHELNARNYFPHKPRIKRSCDITQRKQFRLRHLQIKMANEDISSLIVLDSTGAPCSISDSSVISLLDTSSIIDQTDHVDQCVGQKESLRSVIILSDLSSDKEDDIHILRTSTDEQTEGKTGESFTTPATTVSVQGGSMSDSGAENKEPMPAREAQVPSTPVDRICKRRRISEGLADDCASTCDQPLASTPLAGSAIALKQPTEPTVTPITVRYERIRADLSATKKEQKKLLTLQEVQGVKFQELQQEMQRFREETTKKRKREEEEEKKSLSVLLDVKSDEDDSLRPVVIDGSNVAMSHGCGKVFSCKGIALCIQFFLRRGHASVSALVPRHCKNGHTPRSCPIKDAHILDELESKGFLSFTPSRNLNGKRFTPYDDRMIVQLACRNGGVVVSNDNYRDLMKESAEFKAVIESRLIMYTFVGDNFMVPEDPHGRYGPLLSEVLKRPEKAPLPSMVHSALHNHRRTPLEQLRHQWQNRF